MTFFHELKTRQIQLFAESLIKLIEIYYFLSYISLQYYLSVFKVCPRSSFQMPENVMLRFMKLSRGHSNSNKNRDETMRTR